MNELGTRLTATSDLPSILYQILDAIIELQGADCGNVQLHDKASGTLKIVAHRGLAEDFSPPKRHRILIEDVSNNPD